MLIIKIFFILKFLVLSNLYFILKYSNLTFFEEIRWFWWVLREGFRFFFVVIGELFTIQVISVKRFIQVLLVGFRRDLKGSQGFEVVVGDVVVDCCNIIDVGCFYVVVFEKQFEVRIYVMVDRLGVWGRGRGKSYVCFCFKVWWVKKG